MFNNQGDAFTEGQPGQSNGGFDYDELIRQLNGQGINSQFDSIKDAGLYGVNQAADILQNTPEFDPNNMLGGAAQAISDPNNPFLQGMQNFNTNKLQNFDVNNPFMQGFQNYQAQQNNQLGGMFDLGANKIQDKMNSMFGAAGRSGSGYHAGTTGDALGDFGTQLYGNAFDNMQNRNLQAMGMGSDAYNTGRNMQLQGMTAGKGMDLDALTSGNQALQNQTMMQGTLLPDILRTQQDAGWNGIRNYADIVGGLNGTQPPDRPQTSSTDKLLGAGTTLAAAYMMSDRKLKQDIKKVGEDFNTGLNIYEFAYKADPSRKFVGVMADEVEKFNPDAVAKTVDYGKIGIEFREV